MYGRNIETFKNPIQPIRPLTVDPTRRFERHSNAETKLKEQRPRTSVVLFGKKSLEEFQSSSTSTTFSFASDDEYDTDIDDDSNQYRDHSCLGLYKRVCQYRQAVPVGEYLRHHNQKDFSLHYYGIGPKGMRSFIPSLTMNQFITKLDLASNGLGDEGLIYLSHILRDNTAIVELNLAQNFIGIDGVRALCDMLKDNITINHLRMDGNLLDDECARLFAELITNTGQLHTLRLANNKLGPGSGYYLGDALVENTTMQLMDLSGNALTGRGSVALVKGIQKNVFLKIFNLARNGLTGAEFGRAWLNAVKENNTLVELDLSENRLTTESATYIGRAMAKSESFEVVRLTGNPLESSGCYAILKPLIAKNVVLNRLRRIELVDRECCLNSDFRDLCKDVQAQRPGLEIIAGPPEVPGLSLVKRVHRQLRPPIERLHTLFHRRPHLDLTKFFLDVADEAEEMLDCRITDRQKLKVAIREHLGANFSDSDVEKVLKHINHYDCKKFAQVFDNKPTNIHTTTTTTWRMKT